MSMPNRSAEVAAMCAAHPEAFPQDEQNDPARLVLLKGVIIPALNRLDETPTQGWGYMTKTEQQNRVPVDILIWREDANGTGYLYTFVDCMTGTGMAWIVNPGFPSGPPPEWEWTPVSITPDVPVAPPVVVVPNGGPDIQAVLDRDDAIEARESALINAVVTQVNAHTDDLFTRAAHAIALYLPLVNVTPKGQ